MTTLTTGATSAVRNQSAENGAPEGSPTPLTPVSKNAARILAEALYLQSKDQERTLRSDARSAARKVTFSTILKGAYDVLSSLQQQEQSEKKVVMAWISAGAEIGGTPGKVSASKSQAAAQAQVRELEAAGEGVEGQVHGMQVNVEPSRFEAASGKFGQSTDLVEKVLQDEQEEHGKDVREEGHISEAIGQMIEAAQGMLSEREGERRAQQAEISKLKQFALELLTNGPHEGEA